MLRLDWNALQSGDHVLVHHSVDGSDRLLAGVVTSVTSTGGSNDVTVRVTDRRRSEDVRPQRLQVHHDPIELDASCWRCARDQVSAAPSGRRG